MEMLITLGILIIIVILGSFLNTLIPRIPAALFQIVLGAAVTFIPNIPLNFEFESEMFMMLIIAPLLFTDGFNASRKNIWLYKKPILLMALLLVLVTVIIVGTLIHLLAPAIPLAACYVLAAIISPTDAVAVKSITKGMKLPKGLMSILEGESLINDASGIVSFNIALGAILTNTFSIAEASSKFIQMALGGAVFGLIVGIFLAWVKWKFSSTSIAGESNILVVFQLMTPIVVFYVAEHYHLSGIVAVVVTALIFNYQRDLHLTAGIGSEAGVLIDNTQYTASYVLNGFVFTFLGYLLPEIYHNMFRNDEMNTYYALFISIIVTLSLMIVRAIFVYIAHLSFQKHNFTTARKSAYAILNRKLEDGGYSRWQYSVVTSLCGIHGTVTLATALMIPVVVARTGEYFPLRDTILFIASNVVLISILAGTILLPLVVKGEEEEKEYTQLALREKILEGTLKEIKERDITNKSVEERLAYAHEIKNLHGIKSYFKNMQTGDFSSTNKILALHKKIVKAQNNALPMILKDNPNKDRIIELAQIMHLRKTSLLTYSVWRSLIINLQINYRETRLKRALTRFYVVSELPEDFLDKVKEKASDRRAERVAKRLSDMKKNSQVASEEMKGIIECAPIVKDKLLEVAYKVIEGEEDKDVAEFVRDVYTYFAFTLFEVFLEDIEFEEELKELQMEVIRLLKYRVLTMRKLNYISLEDEYTALRNLNYGEAMTFPRDVEEE